jgi:hypothetical protein
MTVGQHGRVFLSGGAARCAPCGMKRTVIPRPAHTATCRSLDRLQGRGIQRRIARGWTRQPLHTFGTRNRRTGQVRGSRKATRKPRVDFSVARRVCRGRGFRAALLRNDSWATRASVSIRWCGAMCTLWDERAVIPRPAHTAACCSLDRLQGRGIQRRIARGWTRQPLHTFGHADARQGQCGAREKPRGAESRFLSRAPGLSRTRVLRGAPSK